MGILFYIIVWNATSIWFQKWIYDKGYALGGNAVEVIPGEKPTALRESVIILGQVIVGAMAATWINITTSIVLTKSYDAASGAYTDGLLQDKLDGAFPGILTMLFVLLCWWLMSKKKVSPIKVMLIMVIVAIVGVLIGFFNPNLTY